MKKLSIGGINFAFSSLEYPIFPLNSIFQKFSTPDSSPHISIEFSSSFPDKIYTGKLIGNNPGNWEIYEKENTYIIHGYDSIIREKNRLLLIDKDFQTGTYYAPPDKNLMTSQKGWFIPRFFSPFGELLIINHLSLCKGVLFHGAALKIDNKVWIFTGPPEAGKSTIMRFWEESGIGTPLNDETIIIREDSKGTFQVFGTPWGGTAEAQSPEKGILQGIFFLHHDSHHTITPLSPSNTLPRLIPQAFLPFWEKEKIEKVLSLLEQINQKTMLFSLGFAKDKNIVNFLLKYFQECA
ncbi:MAG: hypothetical protein GXO71_06030 [Caldiserica bacterium]|nr:hypothetical protein [Caldisericota bacterium]